MNILETVQGVLNKGAFLGVLPDVPDKAIALTQYGGNATAFFDCTEDTYHVQARCRAVSAQVAAAMAEEVSATLDRYVGRGIAIRRISPVLDIGQDSRGRREYTINFSINMTGG